MLHVIDGCVTRRRPDATPGGLGFFTGTLPVLASTTEDDMGARHVCHGRMSGTADHVGARLMKLARRDY